MFLLARGTACASLADTGEARSAVFSPAGNLIATTSSVAPTMDPRLSTVADLETPAASVGGQTRNCGIANLNSVLV